MLEKANCRGRLERSIPALLTGDKRAIVAVEELLETYGWLTSVCGRVKCLEQLVYSLMSQIGLDTTRVSICSEPAADTALDLFLLQRRGRGRGISPRVPF